MAGPEALVKKQIAARLNSLKPSVWFFCPAMGAFGFSGVPDFVGVYKGKFFAIEAKADGKNPTKLQEMCMSMIIAAGGHSMVIRGPYVKPVAGKGQDPGWARFDLIFNNNNWRV